jgi:hypothetical protein
VETLNVRSGPGTVFDIILKLPEKTAITIVSRAPGDDWVRLETDEGQSGWVSSLFVSFEGELSTVPEEAVDFATAVQGNVVDDSGNPIEGVTVAVYQGVGAQTLRTEAGTNEIGVFYAFLPPEVAPGWQVAVVGVECTSPIADAECKVPGRFEPVGYSIQLPVTPDVLRFTYRLP